jgi:hypothetical protein
MVEQRGFNFDSGIKRRDEGWERISLRDPNGSVFARCVTIVQGLRHLATFTPDDVHNEYDRLEYPLPHGNLLGKAFAKMKRERIIIDTLQRVKSKRPESRGREIVIYRHGRC